MRNQPSFSKEYNILLTLYTELEVLSHTEARLIGYVKKEHVAPGLIYVAGLPPHMPVFSPERLRLGRYWQP